MKRCGIVRNVLRTSPIGRQKSCASIAPENPSCTGPGRQYSMLGRPARQSEDLQGGYRLCHASCIRPAMGKDAWQYIALMQLALALAFRCTAWYEAWVCLICEEEEKQRYDSTQPSG